MHSALLQYHTLVLAHFIILIMFDLHSKTHSSHGNGAALQWKPYLFVGWFPHPHGFTALGWTRMFGGFDEQTAHVHSMLEMVHFWPNAPLYGVSWNAVLKTT